MKKVYIVTGQTGEYSDHQSWDVAAYTDEKQAQKHVQLLETMCREHNVSEAHAKSGLFRWEDMVKPFFSELDPGFCVDYTGTWYVVNDVQLLETVPTCEKDKEH